MSKPVITDYSGTPTPYCNGKVQIDDRERPFTFQCKTPERSCETTGEVTTIRLESPNDGFTLEVDRKTVSSYKKRALTPTRYTYFTKSNAAYPHTFTLTPKKGKDLPEEILINESFICDTEEARDTVHYMHNDCFFDRKSKLYKDRPGKIVSVALSRKGTAIRLPRHNKRQGIWLRIERESPALKYFILEINSQKPIKITTTNPPHSEGIKKHRVAGARHSYVYSLEWPFTDCIVLHLSGTRPGLEMILIPRSTLER